MLKFASAVRVGHQLSCPRLSHSRSTLWATLPKFRASISLIPTLRQQHNDVCPSCLCFALFHALYQLLHPALIVELKCHTTVTLRHIEGRTNNSHCESVWRHVSSQDLIGCADMAVPDY